LYLASGILECNESSDGSLKLQSYRFCECRPGFYLIRNVVVNWVWSDHGSILPFVKMSFEVSSSSCLLPREIEGKSLSRSEIFVSKVAMVLTPSVCVANIAEKEENWTRLRVS